MDDVPPSPILLKVWWSNAVEACMDEMELGARMMVKFGIHLWLCLCRAIYGTEGSQDMQSSQKVGEDLATKEKQCKNYKGKNYNKTWWLQERICYPSQVYGLTWQSFCCSCLSSWSTAFGQSISWVLKLSNVVHSQVYQFVLMIRLRCLDQPPIPGSPRLAS